MSEPNRGGHLRSRLSCPGQKDAGNRRPKTAENGTRKRRISNHFVERDQHFAHLAASQRRHRQGDRRRVQHGQDLHR